MGGRKIYLFATRDSFVSPPPPPAPARPRTGYRGTAALPRRFASATVAGDTGRTPRGAAADRDKVSADGRSPRLRALGAGGAGGETARGPAAPLATGLQTKSGPAGSGRRRALRARERDAAGAHVARPRGRGPPPCGRGRAGRRAPGEEVALPQEPAAAGGHTPVRRETRCRALVSGRPRGTEPAGGARAGARAQPTSLSAGRPQCPRTERQRHGPERRHPVTLGSAPCRLCPALGRRRRAGRPPLPAQSPRPGPRFV